MKVIGTTFIKKDQYGDFEWMINQPQYKNSIFIFNDNEEDYNSSKRGGGSACIRPYNGVDGRKPRSHGIPTGNSFGGYQKLDEWNKYIIHKSIVELVEKVTEFGYDTIYYSSRKDSILIGNGIFQIDERVIIFITDKLICLED